MTKRDAEKLVKQSAVAMLRAEIENDPEWITKDFNDNEEPRSQTDIERIKAAIHKLADRLENEGRL